MKRTLRRELKGLEIVGRERVWDPSLPRSPLGSLMETDRTTCRIPGAFDSLNVSRDVKVSGVHCRRGSASSILQCVSDLLLLSCPYSSSCVPSGSVSSVFMWCGGGGRPLAYEFCSERSHTTRLVTRTEESTECASVMVMKTRAE